MTVINAEIIADSFNTETGTRLTTFVLDMPRIVLAEFNTHRMVSRNSASSRAIPFKKMLARVIDDPFIPIEFQKDHKGMQGTEYLDGSEDRRARSRWLKARDAAVEQAIELNEECGVTKQLANRLLEPFMWHRVIATATDWENFFALRAHEAAEIHIQRLAHVMLEKYNKSYPKRLKPGQWHIPFGNKFDEKRIEDMDVPGDDVSNYEIEMAKVKIATARCARVSYHNYEGKDDYQADLNLHDRLSQAGHWSPFEHCARAIASREYCGNFHGFFQYRKHFVTENKRDNRVHREVDLKRETITLGSDNNLSVTLMKGHVDALTFNGAWQREGWDSNLSENPTEQEISDATLMLEHLWGAPYVNELTGEEGWRWDLDKDHPDAEPVTIRRW